MSSVKEYEGRLRFSKKLSHGAPLKCKNRFWSHAYLNQYLNSSHIKTLIRPYFVDLPGSPLKNLWLYDLITLIQDQVTVLHVFCVLFQMISPNVSTTLSFLPLKTTLPRILTKY